MRILALLSLVVLVVPVTACAWYASKDCPHGHRDDGSCAPPSYSGSYGPSSSSGGASSGPTCAKALSLAFSIPDDSGECQLVFAASDRASDPGSSSFSAAYYLPEPTAGEKASCEPLNGSPTIQGCTRVGRAVIVSSDSASELEDLGSKLGVDLAESTFTATLTCTRRAHPQVASLISICESGEPATPVPGSGDAGTTADATTDDADAPLDPAADAGAPP